MESVYHYLLAHETVKSSSMLNNVTLKNPKKIEATENTINLTNMWSVLVLIRKAPITFEMSGGIFVDNGTSIGHSILCGHCCFARALFDFIRKDLCV